MDVRVTRRQKGKQTSVLFSGSLGRDGSDRKTGFSLAPVLAAILVGALIYYLYRPCSLRCFFWADALALLPAIHRIRALEILWPGDLVVYVLPDALFAFATVRGVCWAWCGERSRAAMGWVGVAIVLTAGSEVLQALDLVRGTFDPLDLAFIGLGSALGVGLLKSKREVGVTTRDSHVRSVVVLGALAMLAAGSGQTESTGSSAAEPESAPEDSPLPEGMAGVTPTEDEQPSAPSTTMSPEFAELANGALSPGAFEAEFEGKFWAVLPKKTTECDKRKLAVPDSEFGNPYADEFEVKRLRKQRDEIKDSMSGTRILFEGRGVFGSELSLSHEFVVKVSDYDFEDEKYVILLEADETARWPVGAANARIGGRRVSDTWIEKTGIKIDGKELEIDRTINETIYDNTSAMTVELPMKPDQAETLRGQPFSVALLLEFKSAAYHKKCERECVTAFGGTDCFRENSGLGLNYVAETVAYELRSRDEILARDLGR